MLTNQTKRSNKPKLNELMCDLSPLPTAALSSSGQFLPGNEGEASNTTFTALTVDLPRSGNTDNNPPAPTFHRLRSPKLLPAKRHLAIFPLTPSNKLPPQLKVCPPAAPSQPPLQDYQLFPCQLSRRDVLVSHTAALHDDTPVSCCCCCCRTSRYTTAFF